MKKKFIIYICFCVIVSCIVTSCGKKNTSYDDSTIVADTLSPNSSTTSLPYYYEATSSAALIVKMEADIYFAENKVKKGIIHDYFKEDGAFGSEIISRHSALEGLEYVIELNNDNNAVNVFLCQPNTNPITMACDGERDKIEDWGFTSWEQVLDYYNISDINNT